MQGDIQATASKTPEQLRDFFERVSGSDALQGEYAQREAAVRKCERKAEAVHKKKEGVLERKRGLEAAKKEAERYQKEKAALVRTVASSLHSCDEHEHGGPLRRKRCCASAAAFAAVARAVPRALFSSRRRCSSQQPGS